MSVIFEFEYRTNQRGSRRIQTEDKEVLLTVSSNSNGIPHVKRSVYYTISFTLTATIIGS
jgi:hypothetical protein